MAGGSERQVERDVTYETKREEISYNQWKHIRVV